MTRSNVTIRVDPRTLKKALKNIGNKKKNMEAGLAKAVTISAFELRADIIKRYKEGPKTGIVYRKKGGGTHIASKEGEAPAVRTGALMSSVSLKQTTRFSAKVHSRHKYGFWLEYGTQDIKPRPAWTPATEAVRPKLKKRVQDVLRKYAK